MVNEGWFPEMPEDQFAFPLQIVLQRHIDHACIDLQVIGVYTVFMAASSSMLFFVHPAPLVSGVQVASKTPASSAAIIASSGGHHEWKRQWLIP